MDKHTIRASLQGSIVVSHRIPTRNSVPAKIPASQGFKSLELIRRNAEVRPYCFVDVPHICRCILHDLHSSPLQRISYK